jgi:peptide/nickel transport system substrate-binding protein
MRPSFVAALSLLLAVMTTAGCERPSRAGDTPTSPRTSPTTSTRLVFGVTAEPSSLVPLFGGSAVDSEVGGLLFRELVRSDANGDVGDLAVAVPRLGHGATLDALGRLVVDWTLREARWSDGHLVTSADVVAGWKVALAEDQPVTSGRDLARAVERIDVVDERRFRVVWRAPTPSFASPRVHRVLPAHLVLDADGAPIALARSGFLRRPIGNGPFVLVDDVAGAWLRFKRRPDAGDVAIDEVLIKVLPSTEALTSALLTGDVDATLPQAGLAPTEASRLIADHPGRFAVARAPGTTWVHLDFNLDDAILGDRRVRQAIAHAVDRVANVTAIAGDAYDVDEGFLPRHHPARLALPRVPVDRSLAEQLLDSAGLKRPAPGALRVRADGSPWQLQLAAASGQRDTERLLQLVQANLREVGVDVILDLRPFKVFFAEGAKKRRLPHLAFYAWTVDADSTGASLWRADRIPSADNGWTGLNLPGWRHDEVTRLLTALETSVDDATRKAHLARVQELFMAELPALSFYVRPSIVVARAGVSGLEPTGTASPMAATVTSWRVTTP